MIRLFRHYISGRAVLLLMLEVLVFFCAIYAGTVLRFFHIGYVPVETGGTLIYKALIFTAVMISVMTSFGLYDYAEWEGETRGMVIRLGYAVTVGFFLMVLLFYVFPDLFLGRGLFIISFTIAVACITVLRLIILKWLNLEGLKRRVLVLGTGSRAAKVDSLDKRGSVSKRMHIVGYLPYNGTHHFVDDSKILRDSGSLPSIVTRYGIKEIIVAIRDRRGGLPLDELLECKLLGVKIMELPGFLEREVGQLQLETVNASWMIHSDGFQNGLTRDFNKRIFDLCASSVLLILSLPVMMVASLLILLETGRPIIYSQERVGQNNKVYTIYKFRSMRSDAEKGGVPQWAQQNDDRTTRVGKILRKLRIDELPQIFNVLKGDMSFVGPRPERPFFVDELAKKIPYYNCRHSVKPGITGWAQVRYAYGASLEDALEKLQYDLYYVKNHSMFLDFLILFQTAQVVLWGKGAR